MTIEKLGFVDALYTTVITITTVGFQEPTGGFDAGGRLFTIFVLVVGLGAAFYTAGSAIELAVERFVGGERSGRKMQQTIDALHDHVIVCGFGRVGRNTWQRLQPQTKAVVIEEDPERAERAREAGALVVQEDATHDEALLAAGIDRARSLIACVRNDADNMVIVLSAKARRPDLLVVARATAIEAERKLRMAGADRVVAPQVVGAHRLAALAEQPEITEFLDLMFAGRMVQFLVEQFRVDEGAAVANVSLRESDIRRRAGALVLAVQESDGRISLNPDPDFVIRPGQVIYGIGTTEQVEALAAMTSGD